MAVRACSECKQPISTKARQCPHCGYRRTGLLTKIIGSIIVVYVPACIYVVNTTPPTKTAPEIPRTASQIARDEARNKELGAVAGCRDFIRRAARDPDSVQFLQLMPESFVEMKNDGSYHAQLKTRANNGIGGKTVSLFDCTIRTQSDHWQLVKLREMN